jgi:hypothetical protein
MELTEGKAEVLQQRQSPTRVLQTRLKFFSPGVSGLTAESQAEKSSDDDFLAGSVLSRGY